MKSNFKNAQTRTGDMEPETISKNGARAKKMKKKNLIILSLFFLTVTSMSATEWASYICYYAATTSDREISIEYLCPVVHYDCLSFSAEIQAYSIMAQLAKHNPVFTCEKLELEESGNIKVFLETTELSETEYQEMITSLLMHIRISDMVTVVFADGTEQIYTIEDVSMPFFLPVFFEDKPLSNSYHKMIRLACKQSLQNELDSEDEGYGDESIYTIAIHTVAAGETIYGISKQYGIAEESLMKINDLDDNHLQVGQELMIPQNDKIKNDNCQADNSNGGWSNVLYMLFGASILLNAILFWGLKRRNI